MKRILIAFLLLATPATADEIRGRVLLDDGDTPVFHVRMFGVDTPEKKQQCKDAAGACYKCGDAATKFLADMIGYEPGSNIRSKKEIRCDIVPGQMTFGRMVVSCWLEEKNLGIELARAGWGIAYRRFLYQVPELKQALLDAEDEAREAKRGIWQGEFIEPSKWRRGERLSCEPTG